MSFKSTITIVTVMSLLLTACGNGISRVVGCAPNETRKDSIDFTRVTNDGQIAAYHNRPGKYFMDIHNGPNLEISPGFDKTIIDPGVGPIQTGDWITAREESGPFILSSGMGGKVLLNFQMPVGAEPIYGSIRFVQSDGGSGSYTRKEIAKKWKNGDLFGCFALGPRPNTVKASIKEIGMGF